MWIIVLLIWFAEKNQKLQIHFYFFLGISSTLQHLWKVGSIEEFKFYCCPECVYKSKEELIFQYHLNEKHFSKSSSKLFLSNEDDVIKSENEHENEHEHEHEHEHENEHEYNDEDANRWSW